MRDGTRVVDRPMKISLQLSNATSVATIEEILAGLPDQIDSAELRLSRSMKTDDLVAKQALPFLISTVRQRSKHLCLQLFIQELNTELLTHDPLLFAAVSVSDKILLSGGDSPELTRSQLIGEAGARRRKPPRRKDGSYRSTMSVRVIANDDLPPALLPSHFYRMEGAMISVASFEERIKTIWEPMNWAGSREAVAGISRILWELFENTDKHARVDMDHRLVRHSIRGCMLDYQLAEQMSTADSTHPFSRFLENTRLAGAVHFLFMTIFDSGVGIPEHRRPKFGIRSHKTDMDLLRECFEDPSRDGSNRGRGLPLVAEILRKLEIPGAAYIRSGSVSALLSSEGLEETRGQVKGRTGTLFTVVLPYATGGFKQRK